MDSTANKKQIFLITVFIGITYMWTSGTYLLWTSHLSPLADNTITYFATEVGGCITQIVGILLFSWLLKRDIQSALKNNSLIFIIIIFDGFCSLPVFFSKEMLMVLSWGLIMNLFHGAIAAYYIAKLSCSVPKNRRAFCFGVGYAFGSLFTYPISNIAGKYFSDDSFVWFIYLFFILLSCILSFYIRKTAAKNSEENTRISNQAIPVSSRAIAAIVIILLGLCMQLLFFFPAQAYIKQPAILNFSHMFYAVGLMIAAFINDKKRSAGLILALLSLCFPFLSLALYQLTNMFVILTVIGKIATGFYAVYRIVVYTDLYDNDTRLLCLAPMGLLFGRVGESAGAALGFCISYHHVILTGTTVFLFAATIILVFFLYVRLYSTHPFTTVEDRSNRFCAEFNLSAKELQVFQMLIDGKSNKEIADALFISERTVKFHVHNILEKTDCHKRTDIIHKFQSYS